MPMYEYDCLSCDSRFDLLRRMDQDDSGIRCPICRSTAIQRRLSMFASHSKGVGSEAMAEPSGSTGVSCGRGCPGCACGPRS